MMNIKPTKSFVLRDSSTGELTSYEIGRVYEIDETLGNQLISDGLAVEYLDVVPYGTKQITANGTYDVSGFASVVVDVDIVIITYDANGGTGTVEPEATVAGNEVTLDDGSGLTAPEGKEFAGWATEATATEPDVESPYTVTENITLHAVWVDAE